jgi:hypothetical protein
MEFSVVAEGYAVLAAFRLRACADDYLERSFRSGAFSPPLYVKRNGKIVSAFWSERQVGIDRLHP